MGGAVARVVSPVAKAIGMGGSEKAFQGPASAQALVDSAKPEQKASRAEEEMGARMRGARRRGRQLISDARLNPEAGVETLGGGNNLG